MWMRSSTISTNNLSRRWCGLLAASPLERAPPVWAPSLVAGSIPASWARLPASAGISILPQLGPGLCGSLPTYPSLNMAIGNSTIANSTIGNNTKYYNITNSLGSCLEAPCSLPPASECKFIVRYGVLENAPTEMLQQTASFPAAQACATLACEIFQPSLPGP